MKIRNIFKYPFDPDNIDGIHRALYLLRPRIAENDYEISLPELLGEVCELYDENENTSELMKKDYPKLSAFYHLEKRLFQNVFYNPTTTLSAEAMLSRALELRYPKGKTMPYQEMDDFVLDQELHLNTKSSRLWQSIQSRRLFIPLSIADPAKSNLLLTEYSHIQRSGNNFYSTKQRFERSLAKELNIDPDLVIFHSYFPYHWHDDYRDYLSEFEQLGLFQGITNTLNVQKIQRNSQTIIYIPSH
jgi:hypothetical protein